MAVILSKFANGPVHSALTKISNYRRLQSIALYSSLVQFSWNQKYRRFLPNDFTSDQNNGNVNQLDSLANKRNTDFNTVYYQYFTQPIAFLSSNKQEANALIIKYKSSLDSLDFIESLNLISAMVLSNYFTSSMDIVYNCFSLLISSIVDFAVTEIEKVQSSPLSQSQKIAHINSISVSLYHTLTHSFDTFIHTLKTSSNNTKYPTSPVAYALHMIAHSLSSDPSLNMIRDDLILKLIYKWTRDYKQSLDDLFIHSEILTESEKHLIQTVSFFFFLFLYF